MHASWQGKVDSGTAKPSALFAAADALGNARERVWGISGGCNRCAFPCGIAAVYASWRGNVAGEPGVPSAPSAHPSFPVQTPAPTRRWSSSLVEEITREAGGSGMAMAVAIGGTAVLVGVGGTAVLS